ncbi:hypoxanthine phosphoribosyltransferase [Bacteriovoracaceae bacterium]|nr:hypoxanthine phosphoribosyltransferase [Bacteriovoracaceae bacterium]
MINEINPDVYISTEDIAARTKEIGNAITKEFRGEEVVVLCVLKGAFIFCSDLLREINLPTKLEFISLSSYGANTESSGNVIMEMDVTSNLEGKNVIIVEDIVDTGLTMKFLLGLLEQKKPKTLKVASLLHKTSRTQVPITVDYLGFEIEDKFVIGYGLDYAGRYRELPYIGVLNAGN